MAFIELRDVGKGFGSGAGRTEVLKGLNLEVEEGEFVAIVGYSGSGKTTLMNLLAGLEMPDQGEVLVNGEKVEGPSQDRGLVFQNYSLLPWLTVGGNVGVAVDKVWNTETKNGRKGRLD
ncbi:MAG: ATP-binding cassette domain-containing protein [Verrucomicrobiota bacterium]